jgi:hypothetical protein
MSLSKQSTSNGARSSGGHSYEVLRSQARQIVFIVYSFLKKYASEDVRSKLNSSKCQDITAEACGVYKSSVSRICRDAKKSNAQGDPVFVSPRNKINMPKKVTNLDDFNKDVVRRTVLDFYDREEFPSVKRITFALKQKNGIPRLKFFNFKNIEVFRIQTQKKLMMDVNSWWEGVTLLRHG